MATNSNNKWRMEHWEAEQNVLAVCSPLTHSGELNFQSLAMQSVTYLTELSNWKMRVKGEIGLFPFL